MATGSQSSPDSAHSAGQSTPLGSASPMPGGRDGPLVLGCTVPEETSSVARHRTHASRSESSWRAGGSASPKRVVRTKDGRWATPFDDGFSPKSLREHRRGALKPFGPLWNTEDEETGGLARRLAAVTMAKSDRKAMGANAAPGRDQPRSRFAKVEQNDDVGRVTQVTPVVGAHRIPAGRRSSGESRAAPESLDEVISDSPWPPPVCSLARCLSPQSTRRKAMDKTNNGHKDTGVIPGVIPSTIQVERSASMPDSSTLLRRCEHFQAEMDYLREREGELRGELCRARAENAAMAEELRRTHDVYKEALAARRTAREALSEMAQQNARLVSAFVEKKQDLRNLQDEMNEERRMWGARFEALEAELCSAREEVRCLRQSMAETLTSSDSNSDTVSGISFGGSASDEDSRDGSQPIRPPPYSYCRREPEVPSRTLHEIQLENIRLQEENDQLKQHCQEAVRQRKKFDSHREAEEIKKNGNQLFKFERYQEAADEYTNGLDLCMDDASLAAVLYCNRAAAFLNLRRFMEALTDCFAAVKMDRSYLRAFQRRADAFVALGDFASAAQDLKTLLARGGGRQSETRALLVDVQRRANAGAPIDAYRVLGVSPSASVAEIKSAYRQLALKFHPDKAAHVHGSDVLFKMVAEANAILSDSEKRHAYDVEVWKRRRHLTRTGY